jgi:hypothetical protein
MKSHYFYFILHLHYFTHHKINLHYFTHIYRIIENSQKAPQKQVLPFPAQKKKKKNFWKRTPIIIIIIIIIIIVVRKTPKTHIQQKK